MLRNKLQESRKKTEIAINAMKKGDDKIKNQAIKIWIEQICQKDSDLRSIMNNIFTVMAAGINGKSAYKGGGVLIDYGYKNMCMHKNYIDKYDKGNEYYLCDQIRYLREYLELCCTQTVERREQLKMDVRELYKIEKEMREEGTYDDSCLFVYMVLRKYKEILENWTYTYRLLSAMADIQTWLDVPETRMELIKCLKMLDAEN